MLVQNSLLVPGGLASATSLGLASQYSLTLLCPLGQMSLPIPHILIKFILAGQCPFQFLLKLFPPKAGSDPFPQTSPGLPSAAALVIECKFSHLRLYAPTGGGWVSPVPVMCPGSAQHLALLHNCCFVTNLPA